jgi:hypothetical protein
VTSQGSAYGRFRKSLERGTLNLAIKAAAELQAVTLRDALELCFLLAEKEDVRYPRAARRWLARFAEECAASLADAQIAGAALAKLEQEPQSPVARDTLRRLLELPM